MSEERKSFLRKYWRMFGNAYRRKIIQEIKNYERCTV